MFCLSSETLIGRLRLEPGNVNCHPWSWNLGKDFRLSAVCDVWNEILEVFVQTFIQIFIQLVTERMKNQVIIGIIIFRWEREKSKLMECENEESALNIDCSCLECPIDEMF